MAIDTDDLTDKTYKAIIVEAEQFHHDLTVQFGLLSDECEDELTFIKMSEALAREMLTYDEYGIEEIFSDDPPLKKDFRAALKKILSNISKLSK